MELSKRGAFAGAALRERFTAPPRAELSWANHRWVRYRITMANLQQFLERFARGYDYCVADPLAAGCPPNEPSYAELINRAKGAPPETFFWAPGQQAFGKDATEALAVLATQWGRAGVRLEDPAMQPHTVLRNVPKS